MNAIMISDKHTVQIVEKSAPQINDQLDVIVKINAVGICGTDVHTFLNEHPFVKPPVIVGHECSGTVEECGRGVTNVAVGDRVAVDPVLGCGSCRPCRSGRANACADVKCRGAHVEGAMQQYFKVRSCDVHKLPEIVSDLTLAAAVEPLSVGAQACWRGNVSKDDVIVIFGAGPIGLAVMLNALCLGARSILIDMKEDRLERVRQLGALAVFSAEEPDLREKIEALTGAEGPQVTCDAVGHPAIFKQCVDLVAPTGSVIVLGMDGRVNSVSERDIFRKEMTIVGSRMNSNMFPVVIERVRSGDLHLEQMVSHRYPMERAADAFTAAVQQPPGFLKAVITL